MSTYISLKWWGGYGPGGRAVVHQNGSIPSSSFIAAPPVCVMCEWMGWWEAVQRRFLVPRTVVELVQTAFHSAHQAAERWIWRGSIKNIVVVDKQEKSWITVVVELPSEETWEAFELWKKKEARKDMEAKGNSGPHGDVIALSCDSQTRRVVPADTQNLRSLSRGVEF